LGAAAALLGPELRAGRVGLFEIAAATGSWVRLAAWNAAGSAGPDASGRAESWNGVLSNALPDGRAVVTGSGGRDGGTLFVPRIREGGMRAVLVAERGAPDGWAPGEVALAEAVARRIWEALDRRRDEARLRAGEAEARARADEIAAIYASAPIGLCVLDREGRYLRINDRLAEGNGLPVGAHLGRRMSELLPGLYAEVEPLLRRALAGEELRGVEVSGTTPARPGVRRTWRESFVPLRDPTGAVTGVTISIEETTGETLAARRRAFLLRLEEQMRVASGAEETLAAACEELARELGANRVGVSRVEPDGDNVLVEREWRAEGLAPVLGRHRLGDYGASRLAHLRAGEPVVIADVSRDPRIGDRARYAALGVGASLEIPLVRDGRLRGQLFACDAAPRDWTTEELALARETADRSWEAAERARAEAELRASEARFRQLAETIREVFYVIDLDGGRMDYASPAFEEVWGRSLAELMRDGRTFLAAVHPDDRAAVGALQARLWGGEAVEGEYRIVRPDGSVRHIHDRAVLTVEAATGARRAVGLATDVTLRRRVEERLQLATDAAGIGIFDVNLLTGAIEWDARLHALWGVPRDRVVTDEIFVGGVHPEDRGIMRAAVARALAPEGDGLYRAEYRIRSPGQVGERWIAATGRAHVEGGRATRLIGTVQDITERKAAEAAVAESEERFRALAGSVPALIFVSRPEGGNVYVNERYQSYTGLSPRELGGLGWHRIVHPDDLALAEGGWAESRATGQDYVMECRIRRHDGAWRWHLTRGIAVRDAEGRILQWVGAGTDIQELVEAREAMAEGRAAVERANAALEARVAERTASLAEANARLAAEIERREATQAALVQSQKLEALGSLTSGIAHDFNNIIAAIAGGFSVIERRIQDPRVAEVARHGVQAAERGGALVRQLLAFARQQSLAPLVVDLRALLQEAEPLIARSLGPGIEVEIRCPEGLGRLRLDPVQLETALINLAVNARDAMPRGGRVRIAARACPPDEAGRPLELGPRPGVAIDVSDTGGGIPPEILARVVEPFFTTKGPGLGTGLGLAMVHGFVGQTGGALRIASEPGEGTTVTLYLPEAAEALPEPLGPRPEPVALPAAPGAAVLLVDDDPAVRGVTAAQLSDLGYAVHEAGDAREALEALAARVHVDAVLTDVAMPGQDGVELAAEIRRLRPGLPILFMTGHADRGRLLGETVIDKPFTLPALAASLAERIAAGGRYRA
jgi:PAS domain S-box-containing protein